MSKKTKKVTDSFWLSYSDLLTSLFFIMLVLFVICLVRMKISQGNLVGKIEYYEHILQLENQFKELSASNSLSYNEDNKTFVAKDKNVNIYRIQYNEILIYFIHRDIS